MRPLRKKEKRISGIISTIIKLLGATIIFYLGLSIDVKNTGENFYTDTFNKDFFQIKEEKNESNTNSGSEDVHFIAGNGTQEDLYSSKFRGLCLDDTVLCDKIIFQGKYNSKEKYDYTKKSFGVIDFIDQNSVLGLNFIGKIKEIKISKENGNRRGYATRNRIIINLGSVKNTDEFHNLITHELGHIFDLGYIQGKSKKMHGSFTEFDKSVFSIDDISLIFYKISRESEKIRKEDNTKKDFCSGYGMYDPFEDFSECFNLYLNHNELFRTMSGKTTKLKAKFNFIASLFNGEYIKKSESEKKLLSENSSRRPWDTTKISVK